MPATGAKTRSKRNVRKGPSKPGKRMPETAVVHLHTPIEFTFWEVVRLLFARRCDHTITVSVQLDTGSHRTLLEDCSIPSIWRRASALPEGES
jgi:hypothetical protein